MDINDLKVLEWNNERVLTTKELAQAYECKEKQIRQNFNNHKERYVEGKHYYMLKGDDLSNFKSYVKSMDYIDKIDLVAKNTRHTTIWTKKGAFMVAKLIDTDKAWDMYEQLVDFYFDVSTQIATQPKEQVESIDVLKAIVKTFEETNKRVDFLEQRQDKLEDNYDRNIWLSPLHYNNVKSMVKSRIHELYEGTDTKMAPKYRELYKSINNMCNVTTLKQVKDSDYDKVINHILSWVSLKGDVVSG